MIELTKGEPLEPTKIVLRRDGHLIRNHKGEPLLFDNEQAARAFVEKELADDR